MRCYACGVGDGVWSRQDVLDPRSSRKFEFVIQRVQKSRVLQLLLDKLREAQFPKGGEVLRCCALRAAKVSSTENAHDLEEIEPSVPGHRAIV